MVARLMFATVIVLAPAMLTPVRRSAGGSGPEDFRPIAGAGDGQMPRRGRQWTGINWV